MARAAIMAALPYLSQISEVHAQDSTSHLASDLLAEPGFDEFFQGQHDCLFFGGGPGHPHGFFQDCLVNIH
jgi:hypothetical protein